MKKIDKFKAAQISVKKHFSFISVDTGLHTSAVLWMRDDLNDEFEIAGIVEIVCPKYCETNIDQIAHMTRVFGNEVSSYWRDYYSTEVIIIEGVSFWGDSIKSEVSAKTGSLTLLSYIVGSYLNVCAMHQDEVYDILFQQWGGQMKPDMVRERVQRITKQKFNNQHTYDAVGMGLSVQGKFGR